MYQFRLIFIIVYRKEVTNFSLKISTKFVFLFLFKEVFPFCKLYIFFIVSEVWLNIKIKLIKCHTNIKMASCLKRLLTPVLYTGLSTRATDTLLILLILHCQNCCTYKNSFDKVCFYSQNVGYWQIRSATHGGFLFHCIAPCRFFFHTHTFFIILTESWKRNSLKQIEFNTIVKLIRVSCSQDELITWMDLLARAACI